MSDISTIIWTKPLETVDFTPTMRMLWKLMAPGLSAISAGHPSGYIVVLHLLNFNNLRFSSTCFRSPTKPMIEGNLQRTLYFIFYSLSPSSTFAAKALCLSSARPYGSEGPIVVRKWLEGF